MKGIPLSDLKTQALLMLGMLLNFASTFDKEEYSSTMVASKQSGSSFANSLLEASITEAIDNLLLQVITK